MGGCSISFSAIQQVFAELQKLSRLEVFSFFLLPCMNYWSGVDKNTDTRESIFSQEASLFLLMRENMSLLLRCLNLSWVSSQFHQMTIGNTYFIISPLNYRWDWGVLCPALLFLSLLLCFKNKKESIYSKTFYRKPERNLPASPRELVMVTFHHMWKWKRYGPRKCLCWEKKTYSSK